MLRILSIHFRAARWFSALAALLFFAGRAQGQYDPDWTRNFRIGMLVGFNIKADFKTGGSFNVSGSQPGATNMTGVDHIFDDGYVRVDDSGNAQGYTTYWGYQNESQHVGDTLEMHSTSSYSIDPHNHDGDQSVFVGFDLAYGGNLWRGERLRVGWEFGFGLLPISISDDSQMSGEATQNTYSFNIPPASGGGTVVIPGAPYNGGSSGSGQPSIKDIATLIGSSSTNTTISGSRTLDVILYTFRLGPTLFWDVNDYIGLQVGAGPALGFIAGEYRYNETIDSGNGPVQSKGSFSDSDLVYGGYVNATVTYHAVANGDLYLGIQYMPLGSASFSQGGRQAKLDLSGAMYLSAGINWPF
jgi:hypothetical protein